tara:strand:+ start:1689 stop:1865 length:177 start_codon:yes stop_codon:yes gene_type:complete
MMGFIKEINKDIEKYSFIIPSLHNNVSYDFLEKFLLIFIKNENIHKYTLFSILMKLID